MLSLESLRRAPSATSPIDELLDRLSVGELLKLLTPRQRSIVVAYFYLAVDASGLDDHIIFLCHGAPECSVARRHCQ